MEKREPSCTVGENINGAATMENNMEVPQETKNRATIWSSKSTLGHMSRRNYKLKRYMYPNVHSSTTDSTQDMGAT